MTPAAVMVGALTRSHRSGNASTKRKRDAMIADKQRLREALRRRDLLSEDERREEEAALAAEIADWIKTRGMTPRTGAQIHGVFHISSDAAKAFISGKHEAEPKSKRITEETEDAL